MMNGRGALASSWLGLAIGAAALAGASPACAQSVAAAPLAQSAYYGGARSVAYDPLEGFNRPSFGFSMGLDRAVIAPVAHGYHHVTPKPVRHGVSNFIYNLGEPDTAFNDVAQGHLKRAGRASSRFVINTTVGVLGLFDVASRIGIKSHDSDFGQTLGRWGADPGPYIYVPVLGPTDLRDGLGRIVDFVIDPVGAFTGGVTTTFGATRTGLTVVDTREAADGAFQALNDATDRYATARSAYTQHRAFVVQSASGQAADLPDFDTPPSQ